MAFVGTLGVALFPTPDEGAGGAGLWLGAIHYLSALALFGALIFFTKQFQKTGTDEPAVGVKARRNEVYRACGRVMTVAIALMVLYKAGEMLALYPPGLAEALTTARPIFFGETMAIEAFAISWSVKGQALGILADPPDPR